MKKMEMVCFYIFILSILMIISQMGHFFMILLSFEIITLTLFFICLSMCVFLGGYYLMMLGLVFLVVSVCEVSLGLGLLVSLLRARGFDYLKSTLSLKF